MADYLPRFDSLWSTTTWITAFSNLTAFAGNPPMSADDVYADGKTITIDTNINVASLRTTTAPRTGGAAGGGFRATNNTSLTANILGGTSNCLTFASGAPNFFTLVGNISGSSTAVGPNQAGFNNNGLVFIFGNIRGGSSGSGGQPNMGMTNTGIANIVGNIRGGFGVQSNQYGVDNSGTLNLTGGVFGGSTGVASWGIRNNFGATITLSGSVEGGTGGGGAPNDLGISNAGTLNVIGFIRGGPGATAANQRGISNTGTLNLTGFVIGGANTSSHAGILNTGTINIAGSAIGSSAGSLGIDSSSGIITINGMVIGGGDAGIRNTSTTGSITINGDVIGGGAVGINNTGTCPVYIKRAVGGPGGLTNSTGGTAAGVANIQNGLVFVQEFEYGAQGVSPVTGPVFIDQRTNSVTVMRSEPLAYNPITLFTSLSAQGLFPPASSVRVGTVYGNGDFTGTMIVPTFSAVQVGVPVDDTVGIFLLSPDVFWQFNRQEILNYPDSIGYRIANLATIPSVGQLIGSFNLSPPMSTFNILQ